MNGKKDIMVWMSLGLSAIAVTLAIFVFIERDQEVSRDDLKLSSRNDYMTIIRELEKITEKRFKIQYKEQPMSIDDVISPLFAEMEESSP